jgi:MoaA/NifB/PqqE/SkfB family radical SAM enzyme
MAIRPSAITRAALARLGIRPALISLTYEVTWRCNLACSYCDRHTPMPHEMTRDEIFTVLQEFHDLGMVQSHLDGGEPLMHRLIGQIVDWLTDHGVVVSLNTNGALVPRRMEVVRKLSKVKISLDGPRDCHNAIRGPGSFERAIAGAEAARHAGIPVEFRCTVGRHNASSIEALIEIAEALEMPVVFQPALNSLFLDTARDGSAWQLEPQMIREVFARIEQIKWRSRGVGNAWSSLQHFRSFPEDTRPPCAAGWVIATMDPEGMLFPCGQVNRSDRSNSAVRLGAAEAFARLSRTGCGQCWCARLVEGNYAWGLRVDRMLPPLRPPRRQGAATGVPTGCEP